MNCPCAFQVTVSFAVVAVLSYAQTPTNKTAPAQAQPDTWERSKECAAQAEKVVADRNRFSVAVNGHGVDSWSNHYSPKYKRCFVKLDYVLDVKTGVKGGPFLVTDLVDAFERTSVAESADGVSPKFVCRNEDNPAECERIAVSVWESHCETDHKTDCATSKDFIAEHMKN
jgi:hypothetical protein